MPRDFHVEGPYDVTREKAQGSVFYSVSGCPPEVLDNYGCYVFFIRSGQKSIPWYVGKTSSKFRTEIFTPRNQDNLNLLIGKRGKLQVLFIVPEAARGAKPRKDVTEIEKYLIQASAAVNKELLNVAHNKDRAWRIIGVTWWGRGNPAEAPRVLHTMLSGRKGYALKGAM